VLELYPSGTTSASQQVGLRGSSSKREWMPIY